ncbi:YegS/Rv2252/BmrU family lipid kinase [Lactobacillus sp. CC-MHH1034]|uniref:diacylglycerol/lipid kinase family protein n=1 Tax=Agrilactobacillus fermenti TaxID=2586909 RepID=UPI001E59127C|nr:YegS/Rv2252/BmrU family lipid kinase [Agrilactobacillus fermenti]MCD2255287.1 YegS/Rv2252/BmrU family lipid kinase [Agrilactobacillus fermenti]
MVVRNTKFLHIIANETAGSNHGRQTTAKVQQYLNKIEQPYDLLRTQFPGHATIIAKNIAIPTQLQNRVHLVVVIGGDGTLHQVIAGLRQNSNMKQLPVAYIPSGSGNDFRRSLNIELDPLKNLAHILATNQATLIDIGSLKYDQAPETIFVNNVGIGIDARTVHLTNISALKKLLNQIKLGSFSYLANLVRAFLQQTSFDVQITHDGYTQNFHNIFLVTLGNEPYFGGGVPILPRATFFNHKIDLILVEKMPLKQLIPLFYCVFKDGTHLYQRGVYYTQATQFDLQIQQPNYGQVDGELLGKAAFHVTAQVTQYPFWL